MIRFWLGGDLGGKSQSISRNAGHAHIIMDCAFILHTPTLQKSCTPEGCQHTPNCPYMLVEMLGL